ncbi:hypothetical protein RBB50_000287 [Rhinocladiella similis]
MTRLVYSPPVQRTGTTPVKSPSPPKARGDTPGPSDEFQHLNTPLNQQKYYNKATANAAGIRLSKLDLERLTAFRNSALQAKHDHLVGMNAIPTTRRNLPKEDPPRSGANCLLVRPKAASKSPCAKANVNKPKAAKVNKPAPISTTRTHLRRACGAPDRYSPGLTQAQQKTVDKSKAVGVEKKKKTPTKAKASAKQKATPSPAKKIVSVKKP